MEKGDRFEETSMWIIYGLTIIPFCQWWDWKKFEGDDEKLLQIEAVIHRELWSWHHERLLVWDLWFWKSLIGV